MNSAGQPPNEGPFSAPDRADDPAGRFSEAVSNLLTILRQGKRGNLIVAQLDDPAQQRRLFSHLRQRLDREQIHLYPFELGESDLNLVQSLTRLTEQPRFKALELTGRYQTVAIFVYGLEKFTAPQQEQFAYLLNLLRKRLARLGRPIVLWASRDLVRQLARNAPELWPEKAGLIHFSGEGQPDLADRKSAAVEASLLRQYLRKLLADEQYSIARDLYLPLKAVRAAEMVDLAPPRHTLTEDELQTLSVHQQEIVSYNAGQQVFERGEDGNECYVIVDGQVEVLVPDALGNETVVTRLGRGDFFGEIALLKRVPRTATIRTVKPSRFVVLSQDRVREMASSAPTVLDILTEIAQKRLEDRLHDPHELLSPLRRFAVEGFSLLREAPVDVRDLIRTDRRVVVLGEAGGGKTTVLRRVAWETAETSERALAAGEGPVVMPIYIKLNALSAGVEVIDLILESLQTYGLRHFSGREDVLRLLQGELYPEFPVHEFIFFMDGLNEMSGLAENRLSLNRFIQMYGQQRFIMSCRVQDYIPIQRFRTALLQRLSRNEIETFLVNHLGGEAGRRVARQIHADSQLEDLAQTPLALYMLAQIVESSQESLPKNRGILFERFTARLVERADAEWQKMGWRAPSPVPSIIIAGALANLGLAMQQEEVWTFPRERWLRLVEHEIYLYQEAATARERAVIRSLSADLVHEKVKFSGLLRYVENSGWVEFAHHTLQEFFAALALRDQAHDVEPLISSQEMRRRWQGTIVLLYGIAHNRPELFGQILGDSFDYARGWLVAQCLANAGEEIAVAVRELEASLPPMQHFAMLFSVGLASRQLGRYPEALTYLQQAADEEPGSADVQYELGTLYRQLDQYERAIKHLAEAIQLRPDFVDAYNQLGIAYYDQGKYEEALTIFRATTQLEPTNAHHYYNLATVQKILRDYEEARIAFEKALQLKPDYGEARAQLDILEKALQSGVVRVLESIPMLSKLSLEQSVLLANRLRVQEFNAGQIVFHMGEMGDTFYILESGEVEVLAPDLRGQQAVINRLGPGEFFGEIALLRAVPRTATIRVVSPTRLLGLSREDFDEVMQRHPFIAHNLAETSHYRLLRDRYIGRRVELDDYYDPAYIEALTRQEEVTVVMGDIHGSTYLTNSIGPELMVAFLDEYLMRMSKIIVESGGALDKSLGDSVMGVFGSYSGEPEASASTRALMACLRMRDTYLELRNEWKTKSPEFAKTGMGIGISTGPVAIGTVGHEAAMVGPVVNTSSKLSKMAIKGRNESEIYIDQRTNELLADLVVAEALDPEYVSRKAGGSLKRAFRVVQRNPG